MSGAGTTEESHGRGGALQTEFPFTLPQGYADDEGTLHREGTMRLATAADEILPLKDPRVQANPSYLTVVLLSRVVTKLGSLAEVTPHVVEGLFVADIAHLQDLYERVNTRGADSVDAVCPECGEAFEVHLDHGGASVTTVGTGTETDGERAVSDTGPTLDANDGVEAKGAVEGNPESQGVEAFSESGFPSVGERPTRDGSGRSEEP